jgi:hypothetical protein
VVVEGVTLVVPLAHDTVPTPLLIEQVVALVTPLHVKAADWPAVIDVGLAVNERTVGAGGLTVMVAVLELTLPAAFETRTQ